MAAVADPSTLRTIPLFHNLSTDELARLTTILRRSSFPAGALLMSEEQPGEAAYVIVSGTVKVHLDQADGREVVLAILGPGEVVGEMSLLESLGRSATVTILEESVLFWMDRLALHECLQRMPAMANSLVRILSRRVRLANAQIASLATQGVYGRVARQLLAFAREYGVSAPGGATLIPMRLTQGDLAALVGASRVRVNQVVGFYKQHGYLSCDPGHHFTIHNSAALAQRCR